MSNTNSETEKKERKDRENKVLKQFWLHPALAERIEGAASFTGKSQVDVVSEILAKALKVKIQPDLEDFAEKFGPPQEFTSNLSAPAPKLEPAPSVKAEKRPVGRPSKPKPPKKLTHNEMRACIEDCELSSKMRHIWQHMIEKGWDRDQINRGFEYKEPNYQRHLPEGFEEVKDWDEITEKIFNYMEDNQLWDESGRARVNELRGEEK